MPTSTVKQIRVPIERQKPTGKAGLGLGSLTRFSRRKIALLTTRAIVLAACGFLVLTSFAEVSAQSLRARLTTISFSPATIRVELEFPFPTDVLSFRNAYRGVLGLGERIDLIEAVEASGEKIPIKKRAPGEFQTTQKATRFSYIVNISQPSRLEQMSYVSWLNGEHGLLMLGDLLPQSSRNANFETTLVALEVPPGWTIASNIRNEGKQHYSTADAANAVFLIGPTVKENTQSIGALNFSFISSGQWPFSDAGAGAKKLARKLIEEYSKVTGFELKRHSVVMLTPFPGVGPERWSAEARGNSVVLLMGNSGSGKRVLSRLGIVLSHELFHLWVPNSLKLEGDYDWFFEGFTLYQALQMDLRLGLISFKDYLQTLMRVYESYLSAGEHDKVSLLEASERRWSTSSSLVYDKGMLVAFMYDLSLRNLTSCKLSLNDVYKQLFRLHATGQGNANETIIRLLGEHEGLEGFAKDYVKGTGRINLESLFARNGLEVQRNATGTKLVISGNLTKAQRKVLNCLSYRN